MSRSVVVALAVFPVATLAQQALDAKAATEWYSGITVEGTTSDGKPFRAFHDQSGKITGLVAGQYRNEGTWKIRDDGSVCVDWRDSSWGKQPCYWIKEDSEGYWKIERVDDHRNFTRVKRVQGNKYNM